MLLLHGFGDTPQTLRYLAERANSAGYRVSAPLYPGHGSTPDEFFRSTADEWIGCAREAFSALYSECGTVSVVGLSMGAAITALLAADSPEIKSVVLISPYLRLPGWVRLALAVRYVWGPFAGEITAKDPRSIQDPIERDRNLGYGVVNARVMAQLSRVVKKGWAALPRVRCPTLVIQSRADPRVSPSTARAVTDQVAAEHKRLNWAEAGGHILTVDYGREQVIAETLGWISEWNGQLSGETRQLPGKNQNRS
jgi:carboxylesterase